ncbi:polysaccharide biosynthesis/export family protein [Winogradskyella sp. UBA3174]|uniref:polysaccharide biosynthesis/export family protein n=1 Tax=Winogradskyella sp. UBA3174 TaxID=1947785 RepID=UPI0025DD0969|nr:polysaccharide biosynthesis/export family protein [Winogradskyella sp. UBA3174]|tara:strand:+ start:55321 stop:56082 length:762 start_codon:yes stop_codon:yes gene_type:complete
MKLKIKGLLLFVLISSCTSKKDILYMQDAESLNGKKLSYSNSTIQPNDILKITVESAVPEAALLYNKNFSQAVQNQNIQLLQLDGYLVSIKSTIIFPVLGEISTANKSTEQLAIDIKNLLKSGDQLNDASVNVRLINAKVTILGEVNQPGTYNFTEQNITVLQALGYANDLTINGKRDDVLITREVDGVRKITHIDLTSVEFMNSEFYFIKPNDVIVVNPNNPQVKRAGFIGDVGTVLTIASLVLSITILLSR